MEGWDDFEASGFELVYQPFITKYKLKSQYVNWTQLWPLPVNCVKVSSQSYLAGLS